MTREKKRETLEDCWILTEEMARGVWEYLGGELGLNQRSTEVVLKNGITRSFDTIEEVNRPGDPGG